MLDLDLDADTISN